MADLEISVSQHAGFADASGAIGEKAKDAFDSLGSLLSEAIEPFRRKLADTAASADEIELKLDLALKGGGKWIVVSMEGSATVSVKLVWKKKA
jgi:Trypsin-co-occurring domain 1